MTDWLILLTTVTDDGPEEAAAVWLGGEAV